MRRVGWIIGMLLVLALVFAPSGAAVAWGDEPEFCPNKNGQYYRPDVFPRYETHNKRLLMVNWKIGKIIQEVESSLPTVYFIYRGAWSPDCRYFAAGIEVSGRYDTYDTVIWDLTTNRRVGVYKDAIGWPHPIAWYPAGRYVLVWTRNGMVLWDIATDNKMQLTTGRCGFYAWDWDTDRQQLLAIRTGGPLPFPCTSYHGDYAVTAYDIRTGQKIAVFDGGASFKLSDDTSKLIVYTYGGNGAGITIWDRNTLRGVRVVTDIWVGCDVRLSPDARYVAAGHTAIRVWDLHHLEGKVEDRQPKYRLARPDWSYEWRFVGSNIIEIYKDKDIRRFDLNTGQYLKP